jgi:microcystin-dependent protein
MFDISHNIAVSINWLTKKINQGRLHTYVSICSTGLPAGNTFAEAGEIMGSMKLLLSIRLRYVLVIALVWHVSSFCQPQTVQADASQPFVGEISCGGWNFCPNGWLECNGQLLPIAQNDVLFTLIGTTYGGDGQTTFALPNIVGRTMLHQGQGPGLSNRVIGESGGAETVTLATAQMPIHNHPVVAHTGSEKSASPTNRVAGMSSTPLYTPSTADATFGAEAVSTSGGSQPHNNLQPYLAVKCCISQFGVFPSQN